MRGKKAKELRKKIGPILDKENYLFLPHEKTLKDLNGNSIVDKNGKKLTYFQYTLQCTGKRAEYKKLKKECKKCY